MSSSKRIAKELEELTRAPGAGTRVALGPTNDLHEWHVTLAGPADTPYAGGTFAVVVRLPPEYPFKAPAVRFATRVYHPNVTNDRLGNVCLGLLKAENWKPSTRVAAVLDAVRALLAEPQPDDPLETAIADQFRAHRPDFDQAARDFVVKYAMGPPSFAAP